MTEPCSICSQEVEDFIVICPECESDEDDHNDRLIKQLKIAIGALEKIDCFCNCDTIVIEKLICIRCQALQKIKTPERD